MRRQSKMSNVDQPFLWAAKHGKKNTQSKLIYFFCREEKQGRTFMPFDVLIIRDIRNMPQIQISTPPNPNPHTTQVPDMTIETKYKQIGKTIKRDMKRRDRKLELSLKG